MDNPPSAIHPCDNCGSPRRHKILGSFIESKKELLDHAQIQAVRASVEWFIGTYAIELQDMRWQYGIPTPFPDLGKFDDELMDHLGVCLDEDDQLRQDLYDERFEVCRMRAQGWSWPNVLEVVRSGYETTKKWEIVKCAGCEEVSFRLVESSQLDDICINGEDTFEPKEFPTRYPPFRKRMSPSWLGYLPEPCRRLHKEVFVALDHDCLSIASIGLRALIECATAEKLGDKAHSISLPGQIDKLSELYGSLHADELRAVVENGNAAVHRGWVPDMDDLDAFVESTEAFLRLIFVSSIETKMRSSKIPGDPRRKQKHKLRESES